MRAIASILPWVFRKKEAGKNTPIVSNYTNFTPELWSHSNPFGMSRYMQPYLQEENDKIFVGIQEWCFDPEGGWDMATFAWDTNYAGDKKAFALQQKTQAENYFLTLYRKALLHNFKASKGYIKFPCSKSERKHNKAIDKLTQEIYA